MSTFHWILAGTLVVCALLIAWHGMHEAGGTPVTEKPKGQSVYRPMDVLQGNVTLSPPSDYLPKRLREEERRQRPEEGRN